MKGLDVNRYLEIIRQLTSFAEKLTGLLFGPIRYRAVDFQVFVGFLFNCCWFRARTPTRKLPHFFLFSKSTLSLSRQSGSKIKGILKYFSRYDFSFNLLTTYDLKYIIYITYNQNTYNVDDIFICSSFCEEWIQAVHTFF